MRGSITVFMSLCLSVCILLTGTALESARYLVLKMQVSRALESALDSLFAGYDGDLFDEFGILLLNTADLENFSEPGELLESYLEKELDAGKELFWAGGNFFRETLETIEVTEMTTVVERNGELFARSALDYMKYRTSTKMLREVLEEFQILQKGESEKERLEEQKEKEQKKLGEEEGKESWDKQEYQEIIEESILGKTEQLRKKGVLGLILPPGQELSGKTVTKRGFPSNFYSEETEDKTDILSDIGNNILFAEYLLEHFYSFTDGKGNGQIQYELEYILAGTGNDRTNIKKCIEQLLLLREGMNLITIYSSGQMREQAGAFAAGLVGWMGILPLTETVKAAAAAAWAYGEAIMDVRTLLGGGRVPLLKTEEEWTLGLAELPDLMEGRLTGGENHEEGMVYKDYLRLLLMLLEEAPKYYRAMDMIQCRLNDYKPRFYMKECVYEIQVRVRVKARPLFLRVIGGNKGLSRNVYEFSVSGSRMY